MTVDLQLGNFAISLLRVFLVAGGVLLILWWLKDAIKLVWATTEEQPTYEEATKKGIWKVVSGLILFLAIFAFASSGPRITLEPPEKKAEKPIGEFKPQRQWGEGFKEREEGMRELDKETDKRTLK